MQGLAIDRCEFFCFVAVGIKALGKSLVLSGPAAAAGANATASGGAKSPNAQFYDDVFKELGELERLSKANNQAKEFIENQRLCSDEFNKSVNTSLPEPMLNQLGEAIKKGEKPIISIADNTITVNGKKMRLIFKEFPTIAKRTTLANGFLDLFEAVDEKYPHKPMPDKLAKLVEEYEENCYKRAKALVKVVGSNADFSEAILQLNRADCY